MALRQSRPWCPTRPSWRWSSWLQFEDSFPAIPTDKPEAKKKSNVIPWFHFIIVVHDNSIASFLLIISFFFWNPFIGKSQVALQLSYWLPSLPIHKRFMIPFSFFLLFCTFSLLFSLVFSSFFSFPSSALFFSVLYSFLTVLLFLFPHHHVAENRQERE